MTLNNPGPGAGYAAEFQSSALPWVTSSVITTSPVRYDFQRVSRFFNIKNHGPGELAIGFTRNGVTNANRYVLVAGAIFEAELRVKELHVVALSTTTSASILAGLTNVDSRSMPLLSGTTTGSIGWDGVG